MKKKIYLQYTLGEGSGIPLQYSCLENPIDGGAWWAAVHEVAKSQTRLSDFTFMHWRRKWQPTPVFFPGESQGQRSLVGGHLWGHTESDTTEAMQQQQQQQQYTRGTLFNHLYVFGKNVYFLPNNQMTTNTATKISYSLTTYGHLNFTPYN